MLSISSPVVTVFIFILGLTLVIPTAALTLGGGQPVDERKHLHLAPSDGTNGQYAVIDDDKITLNLEASTTAQSPLLAMSSRSRSPIMTSSGSGSRTTSRASSSTPETIRRPKSPNQARSSHQQAILSASASRSIRMSLTRARRRSRYTSAMTMTRTMKTTRITKTRRPRVSPSSPSQSLRRASRPASQ